MYQFIPSTWQAFGDGGNVLNNIDAVWAAARYLSYVCVYGNGDSSSGAKSSDPGDLWTALRAYNGGPESASGLYQSNVLAFMRGGDPYA